MNTEFINKLKECKKLIEDSIFSKNIFIALKPNSKIIESMNKDKYRITKKGFIFIAEQSISDSKLGEFLIADLVSLMNKKDEWIIKMDYFSTLFTIFENKGLDSFFDEYAIIENKDSFDNSSLKSVDNQLIDEYKVLIEKASSLGIVPKRNDGVYKSALNLIYELNHLIDVEKGNAITQLKRSTKKFYVNHLVDGHWELSKVQIDDFNNNITRSEQFKTYDGDLYVLIENSLFPNKLLLSISTSQERSNLIWEDEYKGQFNEHTESNLFDEAWSNILSDATILSKEHEKNDW